MLSRSDTAPKYRHFWRKCRTTSILSSASNSPLPATRHQEILMYLKREYYSRPWQNIDKTLLWRVSRRGANSHVRERQKKREEETEGGRQREALFLFSIGEKIFYSFVNQFLLHEIHFAADSLYCYSIRYRNGWSPHKQTSKSRGHLGFRFNILLARQTKISSRPWIANFGSRDHNLPLSLSHTHAHTHSLSLSDFMTD